MNHVTLPLYNLGFNRSQAWRAEQVLAQVPGVTRAYVSPETEMAYVEYEPEQIGPAYLYAALTASGFGPSLALPLSPMHTPAPSVPLPRRMVRRYLVVTGAVWLLLIGASLFSLIGTAHAWSMLVVLAGGAIYSLILVPRWMFWGGERGAPGVSLSHPDDTRDRAIRGLSHG